MYMCTAQIIHVDEARFVFTCRDWVLAEFSGVSDYDGRGRLKRLDQGYTKLFTKLQTVYQFYA